MVEGQKRVNCSEACMDAVPMVSNTTAMSR